MKISARLLSYSALLAATCLAAPALAGGTQLRKISSFDDFSKGETQSAIISPQGKLLVGYKDQIQSFEDTELVLGCSAEGSKTYATTGLPARVYEVLPGKNAPRLTKLADLPGVAVTAVTKDGQGRILAATLPGSKIYQIRRGKKPTVFAELRAGRIWDLKMHRGKLYAATGPEGRVFSLDARGKSTLALDTDAVDVLTLLSLPDALLAGTANQAGIYQITKKKEGQLLRTFDGKEVRVLKSSGKHIYVVVNAFESRGLGGLRKMVQKVNETSVTGSAPIRERLKEDSRKASGLLYRMTLTGPAKANAMAESAWEELLEKEDQYFTDLALLEQGRAAMVTSSQEGKVYRVRGFQDATLVADFEQQQASAVCRAKGGSIFAFSAGPAAAHQLTFAPAVTATYTSEPFDATLPAQYGMLRLRGKGKLRVSTRTGPSERIDPRWTAWKPITLRSEGIYQVAPIKARRMRFIQLQVKLASADARLDAVEFFYRPFNLAPVMEKLSVAPPKFRKQSDEEPEAMQEIKWSVDARDDDDLQFELSIRANDEGSGWTQLNRGEPVTEESFELNTQSFPDGAYQVAVRASDEPSNGSAQAKSDRMVSEPFLIDKTRPEFLSVKRKGNRITGEVKDGLSRIHDVSYQIDNLGYRVASPSDGLYDERREAFELELPAQTPASARILIRVRDEQGNRHTTSVR